MSQKGALVVIGSGPGIGRATAAYFAQKGFKHVFLLSRDQARLGEDAKVVTDAAPGAKVETHTIDLAADESSIKEVLKKVELGLESAGVPLEAVLYNGARVGPSKLLEWDAKDLERDLKITTVNLYVVLQWAVPRLLETSKSETHNPAFLTTSGGLYREPFPFLFSLSAGKAAQHNLITSFHKKYEPQIHFALVPISGFVGDDNKISAKSAAEQFWKLYEQSKGTQGEVSVEMKDPAYYDMVEGFRKQVEGS